jgi:CHAD domain-containing protein/HD superfamily phosphodiesterase
LKPAAKSVGLRYWMKRVLEECERVSSSFDADPVHDLRVALRRCRSMADGMMAMDPDPDWKAMKKAGKRLFQRLGDLRDVQIMMDWIEKLHPEPTQGSSERSWTERATNSSDETAVNLATRTTGGRDPAAHALFQILRARETQHKHEARAALDEFDRKQWRQWSKSLPARAARIRPGSAAFKHLALERWTAARELHTRALRNRSQIALHMLRIGIKRFRYIVENFLPAEHTAWSGDLKHMQDLLGEVHDLDVLWATALSCRIFPDTASRKLWHARILEERAQRVDEYRARMTGPNSLWDVWRASLPQGRRVQQIATRRVKLWARALDPDFAHAERVARLALELYDGFAAAGLLGLGAPQTNGSSPRSSLYIAALLHDVGKSRGNKGHHKESLELIRKHETPLGWSTQDMQRAAIVARFHCGALPMRSHKALRHLPSDEQKTIVRLAAILRLANALDGAHDGRVKKVTIENPVSFGNRGTRRSNGSLRSAALPSKNEAVVIAALGYSPGSSTAQTVAAERYLLETVLRRPVIVKPAKAA